MYIDKHKQFLSNPKTYTKSQLLKPTKKEKSD